MRCFCDLLTTRPLMLLEWCSVLIASLMIQSIYQALVEGIVESWSWMRVQYRSHAVQLLISWAVQGGCPVVLF
jgi:hypothetical protein